MIDFNRLKEPFSVDDLEWRVQSCGESGGKIWARVLVYVTARAVMDRLDAVVGPGNWRDEYRAGPAGGVLAGLAIRIGDEWVWKWDGAENTDIEAVKGGLSNALKRVAVKWGIGRYLYRLEESFANVHDGGQYRAQTKDKKRFRWDPPALPAWAIPQIARRLASEGQLNEIAERVHHPEITEEERARVLAYLAENKGKVTEEVAKVTLGRLDGWISERTREAA